MRDIYTHTPEVPDAFIPVYVKWKKEFERYDVNSNTTLVGHSCGGGFLLRWLSENKKKGDKLIFVAPWLDPDKKETTDFFEFKIDSTISKRFNEVHLFTSADDGKHILKSVEIIKKELPNISLHEFTDRGHFCYEDLKTDKFPELLNVIV